MSENIITVDGRELAFTPGETILDVAKRNGIFIPTLCHLEGAPPTGACRVCLVEIEGGRGFSPACSMPAAHNMKVHTNSPAVLEARRTVLALLLQSGNHNCAIGAGDSEQWTGFQQTVEAYEQSSDLCPAYGECKLQAHAYRYQVTTTGFMRLQTDYAIEMASPLIVRDFSRCILCGRCVDACNVIQVNHAINHGFRGKAAKIVAMGDGPLERSDCVYCGQCIQACPVAALQERKSRYKIRPWEARHVRTTCHYCGVGCQMDLHIKDNTIMKVTAAEGVQPNQGRLCVKGRFGYDFVKSPQRLTQPMIRENGKLRKASWEEALDRVSAKIGEIKEREGPDAIAGICSAKSTNEALYLMQKLFRTAMGSNNMGSPHAASGLNRPLSDLENARCIFLIDSDITEEHPVAGTFVKRAVNKGSALIVVDTRSTKIARFATRHLVITPGAESVLVNGLINGLVERGRKCSEELRETAAGFPLDRVSETAGVSVDDLRAVLDLLDAEGPVALVYGSRAASSAPGFLALQELLGNLDRACGGVNYLGDLNNSQGACDMGLLPGHLPGYAPVQWDEVRKHFETAWGCSLNPTPGLGFEEILRNLDQPAQGSQKSIRFLYCVGENLAVAGASVCDIRAALDAVEFLVVQDNLDNETVPFADVVLPAAAWGEDEGTYTNCERRVSRVRRAVSAPEEAKPETWIFTQLARRLGQDWPEMTSLEIWDTEISQLAPQLKGITYQLMETEGVQWSLPAETPGEDPRALTLGAPLIFGKWVPFTYHHRGLLEQCEGLLESLPSAGGIGTHVPPSDPKGVTEKFLQLLESEEKGHAKEQIDDILNTYRTRRGGLIPVLQQVQEILGFLPIPVQNYIAMGLGIPASDVFGVVTFYSFFTMVPRGRHIIRICLGTACFVKGSGKLLDTLQRHLRVDVGQTTEDREYSLEVVRCIGACGLAPVMVVDEVTHGQVQPNEIVGIVESYRGPE